MVYRFAVNAMPNRRSVEIRRLAVLVVVATATWLGATSHCAGQESNVEVPEPEDVDLETKDGVLLKATYYAGLHEKDTPPVMLIHAYQGSRADFQELALVLQGEPYGYAVLVPDLRGHGDSTRMKGSRRQITASRLRPTDLERMVTNDLEACKSFLVDRHNNQELNIDRLAVVGAELGAAVAMNWAVVDWEWPVLATGKQGQDVKALVLISPEWSVKGLKIDRAVAHRRVRSEVAMAMIYGADESKIAKASERLYRSLIPHHPGQTDDTTLEDREVFLVPVGTSLQGTQLIGEGLNVESFIGTMIGWTCVEPPYPWESRKGPL